MPYVSLDLKYRPQTFDEIVGQPHVAQTLKNAIAANRVAHAYLFAGPRGTGKTTTARVLAKALNCEKGPTPEPCGKCESCIAIRDGNALDVVEIDAASHTGVDDVRDLREKVKFTPASARVKVYILDEAHMLSKGAFNALLKTIEEPPPHVFFVLATTEPHRIPPTIHSRCQRFEFRAISIGDIRRRLAEIAEKEGFEPENGALETIAAAARGAMRDALSITDQVVAYAGPSFSVADVTSVLGATERAVLSELADLVIGADYAGCFGAVQRAVDSGKDLQQLLNDLIVHFRNLLLLSLGVDDVALLDIAETEREALREQAERVGPWRARRIIGVLNDALGDMKWNTQHRMVLEMALVRAATEKTERPAATEVEPQAPAEEAESASVREVSPAPEGPLNLDVIRARWPLVKDVLREKEMGPSIVACLEGADAPSAFEDDVVTLVFNLEFHCEQIASRYRRPVEEAVKEVFGRVLKLNCELASAESAGPEEIPEVQGEARQAEEALKYEAQPEQTGTTETSETPENSAVELVLELFPGSEEIPEPPDESRPTDEEN